MHTYARARATNLAILDVSWQVGDNRHLVVASTGRHWGAQRVETAQISPPITDVSGYTVTQRDLHFLSIELSDVQSLSTRITPLGMDSTTYGEFTRTLAHALFREGVRDADVRLQGSSVRFFSGKHKTMPYSRNAVAEEYEKWFGRLPETHQIAKVVEVLDNQWPDGSPRPYCRPFDALYRIGINAEPSDYDVQISSREAVTIIKDELVFRGLDAESYKVEHPTYDFVRKELVANHLRYLSAWEATASELVRRPVSIAIFSESGPPKVAATADDPDPLSSHFRDDDWRLALPPLDGN